MTAPDVYDVSAAARMVIALATNPDVRAGERRAALAVFACLINAPLTQEGIDGSLSLAMDLSQGTVVAYPPPL